MSQQNIMIVEDEQITQMDLTDMIEDLGYKVNTTTDNGAEALELLESYDVDLVLMDIRLNGEMNGIETAQIIHDEHDVPVIYITAHSDHETLNQSKPTEPAGFIVKPISKTDLRSTLQMADTIESRGDPNDSKTD